jgi:ribosomal 50S subunit-associated protein YjgA (DUF615 family)
MFYVFKEALMKDKTMSQNNFQLRDWTPFGGNPVNSKIILFFAAVLAIFVLFLPAWQTLPMLKLREPPPNIVQLLSTLFFIALVVERALEVWIDTLRKPNADGMELAVQLKKEELANTDMSKIERIQIQANLDTLLKDQIRFKSETKLLALWSAAIFGLLISAVGVRTLEAVFEVETNSGALQPELFHEVDVFATGLLIAGGSAVIHTVIQAFTALATATQTLARTASSPNSTTLPPTPTAQQIGVAMAPVNPLPAADSANTPT